MTQWTVQCGYAAYYANTVVVEAETPDEALEKAIETANGRSDWEGLDDCGPTFIDAVAEGDDADPWRDFASSLPVPARFTERGEPPLVTVIVSGGVVQAVTIDGGKVRVHVRDYDTESAAPNDPDILTDADGALYALADWSNDDPPTGGQGAPLHRPASMDEAGSPRSEE
jgi:hypothetical protein